MLTKVGLILHTVKYLKVVQIYYQVYYKLRNKLVNPLSFARSKGYEPVTKMLSLHQTAFAFVPDATGIDLNSENKPEFQFLNLNHTFETNEVDWNYEGKGKLWNYNLNYFEFLFSEQLSPEDGVKLIRQYCSQFSVIKGGYEPYPTSLRGINWIKFCCQQELLDDDINRTLYRQYNILMANIEYHILANHLLENGFSLLFAAYYFQDERFYKKAKTILIRELEEQIVDDGAHFERSPMYHQIILYRILDCINLVQNNDWRESELLDILRQKAQSMLYWLEAVTFSNGDIPMVKDSAFGIAPESEWLLDYARELKVHPDTTISKLSVSGYRKFVTSDLELFMDVGGVQPSYQPAHAHADEMNFVLYSQGMPLIVDTGVSTYEKNNKRQLERSTMAHNCVTVDSRNSSEVWGGFRVAKRAEVKLMADGDNEISLSHDGYLQSGVLVKRIFRREEETLIIQDQVTSGREDISCDLFLHIYPGIEPEILDSDLILRNVTIKMEGFDGVEKESYKFASGFNKSMEGRRIVLRFKSEGKLTIKNAG